MSVLRRGVVGRCGQVSGLCIIINITHALGLEPDLLLFSIRRRTSCFSPPSHLSCSALRSITCPGSEPPSRHVVWSVRRPIIPIQCHGSLASLHRPSASSPGPFRHVSSAIMCILRRSALLPLRILVLFTVLSRRSAPPSFRSVSRSVPPFYLVCFAPPSLRFVSWSVPPFYHVCFAPPSPTSSPGPFRRHLRLVLSSRLVCSVSSSFG